MSAESGAAKLLEHRVRAFRCVPRTPAIAAIKAAGMTLVANETLDLSANTFRNYDASVSAPTAAATDLNQSGEIVAEVPITGIILPPLRHEKITAGSMA